MFHFHLDHLVARACQNRQCTAIIQGRETDFGHQQRKSEEPALLLEYAPAQPADINTKRVSLCKLCPCFLSDITKYEQIGQSVGYTACVWP